MTLASPAAEAADGPRWRPSGLLCLALTGSLLAAICLMAMTGRPGALGQGLQDEFGAWLPFFVSTQFLVLVPVIVALERFRPARPEQRGLSPSVGFDFLYMAVHLPTIVAVAAWVSGPISRWLEANASGLTVDSTRDWPVWLAGGLGLVLADLGAWFSHLLKHKVPLFWRFHMIHHSQTRMSLFTSNRTHPVDALVDVFVLLLPFFILFPSFTAQAPNVFVLGLLKGWSERFQHSNVRTNLGPLRWLFVTPQSHRVHHSTEPEHWNSNYATFLAWDRLFGTQHADDTSYPPTGINDPWFPEPGRWSPVAFARGFVGQLLFPFDSAAVRRASAGSPHETIDVTDSAIGEATNLTN